MGYKLLLADDSITIQKVVELVLTPENFQVRSFNDGEQALSELVSYMPHIVLADIDMPKLNGYQLCEKIKDNPATADTPVILLAGAFEPFDEEYAKKSGADDFIIKPFESQELISKVKALVKEKPQDNQFAETQETQDTIPEDDPFAALDVMPEVQEEAPEQESASTEITFNDDDFDALQEADSEAPQKDIEDEPMTFQDAFSEALQRQEKEPVAPSQPLSIDVSNMPSKEEVLELFRQSIDERMIAFFNDELRETLIAMVQERVESLIKEAVPLVTEQVIQSVLHGIAEETRDSVVAILNRVVPETTKTLVEKEINRITAELPY